MDDVGGTGAISSSMSRVSSCSLGSPEAGGSSDRPEVPASMLTSSLVAS